MKLEVLLSTMNLNINDLDKMNITSLCTVINQCGKKDYTKYKNFKIYSYDEIGLSNSRNRGLEHIEEDIILLCDDDVIYNKDYEKIIIDEFKKNKNADVIIFNMDSPYRSSKQNSKSKRLNICNILKYESCRIAFKRNNIKFNKLFGAGAKYTCGEDTLFLVDCLKNNLKIYSSIEAIGTVYHKQSTWFKGYNEKYFFDKGAVYAALNKRIRYILFFVHLIRHKNELKEISFKEAYKAMNDGANDYLNELK